MPPNGFTTQFQFTFFCNRRNLKYYLGLLTRYTGDIQESRNPDSSRYRFIRNDIIFCKIFWTICKRRNPEINIPTKPGNFIGISKSNTGKLRGYNSNINIAISMRSPIDIRTVKICLGDAYFSFSQFLNISFGNLYRLASFSIHSNCSFVLTKSFFVKLFVACL